MSKKSTPATLITALGAFGAAFHDRAMPAKRVLHGEAEETVTGDEPGRVAGRGRHVEPFVLHHKGWSQLAGGGSCEEFVVRLLTQCVLGLYCRCKQKCVYHAIHRFAKKTGQTSR